MSYSKIIKCRTCHSKLLNEILNLGLQPLANNLNHLAHDFLEPKFPLVLVQCKDCGLVQLNVNIEPELMFSSYNWVTGTSSSSVDHCRKFVKNSIEKAGFQPESVLEIGSNDGTLLSEYAKKGIKNLVGIDPATNVTQNYVDGITVENLYFSSSTADKIKAKYGEFDLVVARNVFSHVPDFVDAMRGVSKLLSPHSLFLMEFHWTYEILQGTHYDSIYHEHTYYHSIDSVSKVLQEFNLKIFDAFKSPISGGSLIIIAGVGKVSSTPSLDKMMQLENSMGVSAYEIWEKFSVDVHENIKKINEYLNFFSKKTICAFGASARSSTILNVISSDTSKIWSIAENNPRKWGKYSPGARIPIESVDKMLSRKPDLIVVFPFNFKREIIQQLSSSGWSGSLLFPIPHPPELIEISSHES